MFTGEPPGFCFNISYIVWQSNICDAFYFGQCEYREIDNANRMIVRTSFRFIRAVISLFYLSETVSNMRNFNNVIGSLLFLCVSSVETCPVTAKQVH